MLALHIIAMVSTTIGAVIKAILLLLNRKETFRKVQSATTKPIQVLLITGILAGIYMVVFRFGSIVPPWLIVKLVLFATGGILVVIGEKKENRTVLIIGALILLLVWTQANIKIS